MDAKPESVDRPGFQWAFASGIIFVYVFVRSFILFSGSGDKLNPHEMSSFRKLQSCLKSEH